MGAKKRTRTDDPERQGQRQRGHENKEGVNVRHPLPQSPNQKEEIRMTCDHVHPKLAVQHPAPAFTAQAVVNGEFKEVSLSDYKGKYVVLLWYPLDFTFVCPTEILAFNDNLDKFRAIGCEVLALSTDSHFSHLAWVNTARSEGGLGKDLKLPLVSDKSLRIAKDYGVLIEGEGIALRGLFIINEQGILRQMTVNDLPVGRSVEEALRLVKAFQYTDKHGEVCPAGWNPNDKTMVPDVAKSKDYFRAVNK